MPFIIATTNQGVVGSNPAGRANYFKRLSAKTLSRFSFAWGLLGDSFPSQSFPCNHREASVRAMALISDAIERFHQLGDLRHRVVRSCNSGTEPEFVSGATLTFAAGR